MTATDKLYYRIGEVADLLGVDTHVLRYWEGEFRFRPHRSGSGQRIYRQQDIDRFARIKALLHEQGFTIAGARRVLQEGPDADPPTAPPDTLNPAGQVPLPIQRSPEVREVIREVPVEVIREVVREVPVEVIREVIREVPVEVVREVIREVPVEVVREVIREVPVEVVREVIREVPVEVVREVVREIPVEVIREAIPDALRDRLSAIRREAAALRVEARRLGESV